jgi:methylglyoxal synthase
MNLFSAASLDGIENWLAVSPPALMDITISRGARRHVTMAERKVVLIAHDSMKRDMVEWAAFNKATLKDFKIYATEGTGREIIEKVGLDVILLLAGPQGGDAQVGAMIAEGKVDLAVFLWDPLTPQPHDVDVKALLRLAVLHDIPIACNRSTADFLVSSPLLRDFERYKQDRTKTIDRPISTGVG